MADEDGTYLEFIAQGSYIKVVAIDASTGLEVSIVGAVGTSRGHLERLVMRKLELARERANAAPAESKRGPGVLA